MFHYSFIISIINACIWSCFERCICDTHEKSYSIRLKVVNTLTISKKYIKRVSDYCLVHMNRRHSKKCMTVNQYCFEALTLLTAVVDITVFPSSSFIYGITPRFGRVFGCPAVVLWYKLVWEVCHRVGVTMRLLIIPSLARREVLSHIDTPFVQMWLTVIETIVG